jgi:import inner membrane translocase subunit TIM16
VRIYPLWTSLVRPPKKQRNKEGMSFQEHWKLIIYGIDAKQAPPGAITSDVAGVRNATSGSWTDRLTREHRMTLDEAHLILNTKREDALENVLKVRIPSSFFFFLRPFTYVQIPQHYEHLFKMNSPAPPPEVVKPRPAGKQPVIPSHSHYLQSKVVRARERIEAELKIAEEDAAAEATREPTTGSGSSSSQPPPPPEGGAGPKGDSS